MYNKSLDKTQLQIIAALAMTADHAAVFAPDYALYFLCKFIGKITVVIMCYFIAEGYYKTHDIKKYVLRLGIFAAVSQIPFYLYINGKIPADFHSFLLENCKNINVIFTLLIGLCLLAVIKSNCSKALKATALILSLIVTKNSDWSWFCVLLTVIFGIFHGNLKRQAIGFTVIFTVRILFYNTPILNDITHRYLENIYYIAMQFGAFIALPLIAMYNGKRGNGTKYGLYVFYPLHLLIICIFTMLYSK